MKLNALIYERPTFPQDYQSAFSHDKGLHAFITSALKLLPSRDALILDAGCGTGKPVSESMIAAGHRVIGIDIAEGMLKMARTQVPYGTFLQCDMKDFSPSEQFDGMFAILSLFLLTGDEMVAMSKKWSQWMKPGAYVFLGTIAAEDMTGTNITWHKDGRGADGFESMFMGSVVVGTLLSSAGWKAVLEEAGFEVVGIQKDYFVPSKEMECDPETHCYITARRRSGT